MTRLLVITTLYPSPAQQRHGIFVETRLRHLVDDGQVTATVIAPVPWFPLRLRRFPEYSRYLDVPAVDRRHGIEIHHPRYLVIPKIGMLLTPFCMALSLLLAVRRLRRQGLDFDVVDSHYYYPDGVAVSLIARFLARPFTVTARGTDINLIPAYRLPRKLILWTARRAAASITVCKALKDRMVELGAQADKIHVLRNGVDLEKFRLLPRAPLREEYQLTGTTLLSVGHLIERKGHDHVIDALQYLPDVELLIAGDGEEEARLRERADRLGVSARVRFLGALAQEELARIYNAVDIMVLASSREGWANVLLESMACGTPVVASSIWGTPEVVADPAAGLLFEERSGRAIADGIQNLLSKMPPREDTRAYAERFSWEDTVAGIKTLLGEISPRPGLPIAGECGSSQ